MNTKKFFAIFLSFVLLLSCGIICPAAEEIRMVEYVVNGDFETESTVRADWPVSNGEWGKEINLVEAQDAPLGKTVLQIKADAGPLWVRQKISFLPNTEYTVTYNVKPVKLASGTELNFKFYTIDENGKEKEAYYLQDKVEGLEENRWNQKTKTIITGESVVYGNIMLVNRNGGEIFWDGISVQGPAIPEKDPIPLESTLPAFEGTENLITNSGFEIMNADGYPEGWKPFQNKWEDNAYITVDREVAYEGEASIRISTESGGNPWVMWMAQLEPNTTYQLTGWVRVKGLGGTGANRTVRFKKEYYSGSEVKGGTGTGSRVSGSLTPEEDNRWVQVEDTFTTPDNTQGTALYCRLHANGTVWFDDVQLHKISRAKKLLIDTDQYFYYPDIETGYAEAKLPVRMAEELRGGSVDFALLDADKTTVLKEQKDVRFTDDKAYFDYPIALLAKEKTAYYVQSTLKDASGTILETAEMDIYKYPRPAIIENTGILNENGEPYLGTVIYHAAPTLYDMCEQLGFNIVLVGTGYAESYKIFDRETAKAKFIALLDDLHSRGMKAIMGLYSGMRAAGHPENAEVTKMMVTDALHHPAIFGYALQDEPASQIPEPEQMLKESYKMIRDIDDIHPVYMLEADMKELAQFSKFADFYATDPYPNIKTQPAGSHVADFTSVMRRATEPYGKPTAILSQAFTYQGFSPEPVHLRSFWYQTLMEGGTYPGWFSLSGGIAKNESHIAFFEKFMKEEQALSLELFGTESTLPVFSTFRNLDYAYDGVVKDGDLYMLILNRRAEAQTITVPLTSQNGIVTASGAAEELYALDGGVNPKVENGNLEVDVPASAVALMKISADIRPEDLQAESFEDLAGYEWAAEAIEKMYRADVVNKKGDRTYAPAESITRGDFARYLIRALDLNVVVADLDTGFTDVQEDAPYYREVCIGKALGILRGVDEEHYNPEAYITRQDLMVICARGLHYKLQLGSTRADLSTFSDNTYVADYAASAVAEMISAEIIRGNADGTINPLGNTTRAEAAVIMQRIMER